MNGQYTQRAVFARKFFPHNKTTQFAQTIGSKTR